MSDHLARARALVAAVTPEDLADAEPDDDLRDFGLDSIRVLPLITELRARGVDVDYADVAGRPSLAGIAALLTAVPPPTHPLPTGGNHR